MQPVILVAEDETSIVESLTFILRRAGADVRVSYDGEQAIRDIANVRPHAVVLDIMMPRKDGFEVLKATRANPDLVGLPIIMLTAKGQESDREKAEALGASAFMTKPFSNAEVVETVMKLANARLAARLDAAQATAPAKSQVDG